MVNWPERKSGCCIAYSADITNERRYIRTFPCDFTAWYFTKQMDNYSCYCKYFAYDFDTCQLTTWTTAAQGSDALRQPVQVLTPGYQVAHPRGHRVLLSRERVKFWGFKTAGMWGCVDTWGLPDVQKRHVALMCVCVCVWASSLKGADARKHKVCYGHPMTRRHIAEHLNTQSTCILHLIDFLGSG